MKNITTQFFVTFGVIFLILMVIGLYFLFSDAPGKQDASTLNQNDDVSVPGAETTNSESTATAEESTVEETSGGFELSSAQVDALVSLGIDPAEVPSSVSAEQETCFIEVLGEARVEEIKAGAVPNALEFVRARSCI